jgi:RNA polymerase sigma factor (sigma-70 family)
MRKPSSKKRARHDAESHALMCALKKGAPCDTGRLVELNDPLVRAYAGRFFGEESEADVAEASSDVWTAVLGTPRIYDEKTKSFSAWICVVTRNRCLRMLADRSRHARRTPLLSDERAEGARSREERPDVSAETAEDLARMARAVAALPEKQRALALAFAEGKSIREMAEASGTPVSTVQKRRDGMLARLTSFIADGMSPLSSLEKNMSCDELVALTAGGPGELDAATLARCDEHARGCDGCKRHMLAVVALYHTLEGQDDATTPREPGPSRLWLYFLGGVATVSLATGYALFHERPQPTGIPKLTPIYGGQEPEDPSTYTTPGQWMAYARSMANRGRKAEAKIWCQKVLDWKSLTPELRAEAQEFMDEIDKH